MSKPTPTPRPLSGYALTHHFRKLRLRWDFTPLEAYLFFELTAICNEEGWPAEFSVKNSVLTGALGCSEKGLIKARKTLALAGLLTYTEGQNRRPTAYRFYVSEGLPEVSVTDAKDLPEVSNKAANTDKHLPEGLPKDLPEVSPYKEQTKTKITLSESEGVRAQNLTSSVSEQTAPLATEISPTPSPALVLTEHVAPPTPKASRASRKRAAPPAQAELLPDSCPLADLLNPGGLAAKVQELAEPLTLAQAERLLVDYNLPALRAIFCEMANWKKLLSSSTSANLTARNWLSKRPGATTASAPLLPTPAALPEEELDEPARLFRAEQAQKAAAARAAHFARWAVQS